MKNFILKITYKIFMNFFLTSDITKRLYNRLSIVYPLTKNAIPNIIARMYIKLISLLLIVVFSLMIFANISVYYMAIVVLMSYVICSNYIYKSLEELQVKLLVQLEQFITDVRFRFQFDGMLLEALLEAINNAKYEMMVQGEQICEYLSRIEESGEVNPYKDIAPDKFFMTFYAMCETVLMYGDKKIENNSLFLKNLAYLKEDINIEILKRKKVKTAFMGLIGVTLLPVFAIKPIEYWAVNNMPDIKYLYEGKTSAIITISLVIITIIIYSVIVHLKYEAVDKMHKSSIVVKISKNKFISDFFLNHISKRYHKYTKLNLLLKKIVYPYDIKEFLIKRYFNTLTVFIISNTILVSIYISEKTRYSIFAFLLTIILSIFAFFYENAKISFIKQVLLLQREEEVVRFQTIILIMMHMDRVTVESIINWIEEFAVVFKSDLEIISDKFSYKGFKVFVEYKDKIAFLPFARLMDSFIACDSMNIERAFEDIETDRRFYVEKHKQDNEQMIDNKAMICKMISFIPICVIIITKLIYPFVLYGVNQLSGFNM